LHRAVGGRKDDEKGIALRVNLDASVATERLAEDAPVLS
jgi:hypothetical protein